MFVTSITQADLETGFMSRPPKLLSTDDFPNWKNRMKAYFYVTDFGQWVSTTNGPHCPMTTRADGVVAQINAAAYTENDKLLILRDYKAFGSINMALPADIMNMFEEYKTAQTLWQLLCDFYEGNSDLKEGKKDMLQK
ncbi:hypothetical protein L1987_48313 [Smallanthus sonchifolius]|uniref:Uncharacterized protein n=1 Tax=Smallanthus sonchifolius TaxID=185202 RepID=A0ACB9FS35_9ASTR|nr:hypothetical protein L1987_48313 [Smallanthus sonchifolius]